jgi:hypothetical protein
VLEPKGLVKGGKKTIQIPFNNTAKRFAWRENSSIKEGSLTSYILYEL